MTLFRWAIVDIETTGLQITRDSLLEISVLIMTQEGIEVTWHSLIRPLRAIPEVITCLTGINDELVSRAPLFGDIAEELYALLQGAVFVAHNARFDYGFLKNAFKSLDISLQMPVLCSIKLFKQFYPTLSHYSLKELGDHFGIDIPRCHRAKEDTQLLRHLLIKLFLDFSQDNILQVAQKICQKSSIPAKLVTNIDAFPNTPGVYLFYSRHSQAPIYIGKSVTLRQRILSHFSGDYLSTKEFTMAQRVERIEVIPTAGELSALLLESQLIKEQMPIYNRRLRRKTQIVGFKLQLQEGYYRIAIAKEFIDENEGTTLNGAFRSMMSAKKTLLALVKQHGLCPKLCYLEQTKGACFSSQLKRCQGACIGQEDTEQYNQRVFEALRIYQEEVWPFKSAIAIKESCPQNNQSHYLVFNQWRHLGNIIEERELASWRTLPLQKPTYHYDAYKILLGHLKHKPIGQLIVLE